MPRWLHPCHFLHQRLCQFLRPPLPALTLYQDHPTQPAVSHRRWGNCSPLPLHCQFQSKSSHMQCRLSIIQLQPPPSLVVHSQSLLCTTSLPGTAASRHRRKQQERNAAHIKKQRMKGGARDVGKSSRRTLTRTYGGQYFVPQLPMRPSRNSSEGETRKWGKKRRNNFGNFGHNNNIGHIYCAVRIWIYSTAHYIITDILLPRL